MCNHDNIFTSFITKTRNTYTYLLNVIGRLLLVAYKDRYTAQGVSGGVYWKFTIQHKMKRQLVKGFARNLFRPKYNTSENNIVFY